VKIRIVGLLDELPQAAERLGSVFEIVEISNPIPRRGNTRQYSIYLEIRL
jgi:hypothetical protein